MTRLFLKNLIFFFHKIFPLRKNSQNYLRQKISWFRFAGSVKTDLRTFPEKQLQYLYLFYITQRTMRPSNIHFWTD